MDAGFVAELAHLEAEWEAGHLMRRSLRLERASAAGWGGDAAIEQPTRFYEPGRNLPCLEPRRRRRQQ